METKRINCAISHGEKALCVWFFILGLVIIVNSERLKDLWFYLPGASFILVALFYLVQYKAKTKHDLIVFNAGAVTVTVPYQIKKKIFSKNLLKVRMEGFNFILDDGEKKITIMESSMPKDKYKDVYDELRAYLVEQF